MNFDLNSSEFWDRQATRKEVSRVFDICYGCTLCHTLCPSFVDLFRLMDENFGEPDALKDEQLKQVVDLCYQCKLCYTICPYVPGELGRAARQLGESKSLSAWFDGKMFGRPPGSIASHLSCSDVREVGSQTPCSPEGQGRGKGGALLYLHGQLQ